MREFTCVKCHRNKPVIKNFQPVPTTYGKWCQHCWASFVWGKDWADRCEGAVERARKAGIA